ncbi:unnamed protein product, partial [Bubo scandiacus]
IFSHSSYIMFSSPFTIFVALFWTHSNIFLSFLYCGVQNCTQYSINQDVLFSLGGCTCHISSAGFPLQGSSKKPFSPEKLLLKTHLH